MWSWISAFSLLHPSELFPDNAILTCLVLAAYEVDCLRVPSSFFPCRTFYAVMIWHAIARQEVITASLGTVLGSSCP